MTTVAVTGATGFVGGQVVRRLAASGIEVLAFGRRPGSELANLASVTYARWELPGALEVGRRVDAVVHCAGTVSDWGPRETFMSVNVRGTEAVVEAFAGARRFVHISTASVYDPRVPKCLVTEDQPYPSTYLNAYAESKMLAELAVRAHLPDAVILRPHAVYGRGDTTLLPRLRAARRLGFQLYVGRGHNRLSITHVDNLVDAIELALASDAHGTYNIADAATPQLRELLAAFLDASGLPGRTLGIPAGLAWRLGALSERAASATRRQRAPLLTRYLVAQLASEYTLDLGRARRELGYAPSVGFQAGIRDAVAPGGL